MELLVLVHPGSLCGSFAFNGGTEAELKALLAEVAAWQGTIVTIDNDLTDEIDGDRDVRRAYDRAEANYEADGWADDLAAAAAEIASDYKQATRVVLTGAWVGESGCVTCVADNLRRLLKCPIEVSAAAARDE